MFEILFKVYFKRKGEKKNSRDACNVKDIFANKYSRRGMWGKGKIKIHYNKKKIYNHLLSKSKSRKVTEKNETLNI